MSGLVSLFRMPSLGSDMERATLIEWLVKPGDPVRRGDLIAVVETDKGAIEVEVFEDGYLERYLVDLYAEVEVGTPLAEIGGGGGAGAAAIEQAAEAESEADAEAEERPAAMAEQPAVVGDMPQSAPLPSSAPGARVSPAARKLAGELGVDVSRLRGSGPQGAVLYDDVQAAAGADRAVAAPDRQDPMANMRRAIAAAMARSKREIPHYYLDTTMDIEDAVTWLSELNASRPPAERVLALALYLKACAVALRKYPEFNGWLEGETYRASSAVHVGVAIAIRGGGLVAPAIHDADQLSVDDLMARLRDLTGRVRAGRFRASELRDPTVTVTSLGERGVERVVGVIYPPQVACIGFGKIVDRPWSMPDRSVRSRQTVTVSLAADHRVSDGRRGALLLSAISAALQDPGQL